MNRYGVILGAGMGTRMKSEVPKVLHHVMGKPMIQHAVDALETLKVSKTVVVTGHKAELVEICLGNKVMYARQEQQLGTAHAVKMAENLLVDLPGTTIITYGDVPLLSVETIKKLFENHERSGVAMTMLTAKTNDPTGYGRIVRDATGKIVKIVEHKDASFEQLQIKEINSGVACYNNQLLFKALQKVRANNLQKEYYLTDLVEILVNAGQRVNSLTTEDFIETLGVNDRMQLAQANNNMKMRINKQHMENGVTIIDPATAYIEMDVQIGSDVIIEPNVHLKGSTVIDSGVVIGNGCNITDSHICAGTQILSSYISDSKIGANSTVGPFAHIRTGADVGEKSRIGNFVEIKKSILDEGVKAAHLAYMGDSEIGANVNISCGVITANYDGKNKYKTEIGANAMIGSNVNLIAPVKVGEGAYIAAGSTVTKNVPADALAIARTKQENKENYAKKL